MCQCIKKCSLPHLPHAIIKECVIWDDDVIGHPQELSNFTVVDLVDERAPGKYAHKKHHLSRITRFSRSLAD